MVDHLSPDARSLNMSKIRGKDTSPEIAVRSFLFRQGFRFRKNDRKLPGKPDVVLPKYKVVVFVNGCFWHGHDCNRSSVPKTNSSIWRNKIEKNKTRDEMNIQKLHLLGWNVYTIWTCSLKEDLERLSSDLHLMRKDF